MPGLRRVTLNLNTEVGDKGAKELADTLRDDVCLKGMVFLETKSRSTLALDCIGLAHSIQL